MSSFSGATLMITGGTGSFGNAVLNRFLKTDIGEIRIFSRDEKKQDDMRHEFQAKMPEAITRSVWLNFCALIMYEPSSITFASTTILTPFSRSKVVITQVSGTRASISIPSAALIVDLPETAYISGDIAALTLVRLNIIFIISSPFWIIISLVSWSSNYCSFLSEKRTKRT